MIRLFFYSLTVVLFLGNYSSLHADEASAKNFIEDLGRRAIVSLTKPGVPQSTLEANFQSLLEQGFDVPSIARYVMGRHWRTMTPDQQARFVPLFEKRLKKSYANRFQEYRDVEFKVTGSRPQGGTVIVKSTIQKPGGPVTPVDWRVYGGKIHDVIVEGVSMSITIRDEYNALIQSHNGNIESFLKAIS
jgi:phospholipid transport system substrate-binding protein